jgi:hypothetical protein
MVHMKPRLDMITTSYCYDESEPSDEKDDCSADIVEEDG